jgi:hypothetical protein
MNVIEIAAHLAKTWGSKTLEDLRVEAEKEQTGIAFESMRAQVGQRFMIIICLTDVDQITLIEKALDLVDDGVEEDWSTLTLAAIAMRTAKGVGFAFESQRDEYKRRSALVLAATEPQSVKLMETMFALPN